MGVAKVQDQRSYNVKWAPKTKSKELGKSIGETWVLISKRQGRKRVVADGTVTKTKKAQKVSHHAVFACRLVWIFAEDVDLRRVLVDDSLGRICG
ncbi:hypothetical protein VN97_g7417 [Penicillium thymicola]|uniref:Uncharacterized protein n=1 Tax=Penicillium thymicola TaxID=293382 RepID=A0AAI9TF17_PENTH|nr:hypothetical protein VN97_g7417 [Penicillium thymicola]